MVKEQKKIFFPTTYNEENIKTMESKDHIRLRSGMYIGKTGDGSTPDDGLYTLLKECIDNSIDEYNSCTPIDNSIKIDLLNNDKTILIEDFGRGIPIGKLEDCVSKINTGGKYDTKVFKKSVGLNGVGLKAVNALSRDFKIISSRDGKSLELLFNCGIKIDEKEYQSNYTGTKIVFTPDDSIFNNFSFNCNIIEEKLKMYSYLNKGMKFVFNDKIIESKNGLIDFINSKEIDIAYQPIILQLNDIEVIIVHQKEYKQEQLYSFVNGQYTHDGGTHLEAFKDSLIKGIRSFYKKDFETIDIKSSIVGAISIRIEEPSFESQTKCKLSSKNIAKDGCTIKAFIKTIENSIEEFFLKNKTIANQLLEKIKLNEKQRKAIEDVTIVKPKGIKANLITLCRKLRDSRYHRGDGKGITQIFIVEGQSAMGSLTQARNPELQAVFALKGKPLNCFGLERKEIFKNEELGQLITALGIEKDIENRRYDEIILATDADVDGMHIRLLLLTFFLTLHKTATSQAAVLKVLETPLFRVNNGKKITFCFSEEEKQMVENESSEVTRFKGIGEISPEEFRYFIGANIKTSPLFFPQTTPEEIEKNLSFFSGKNTDERREYILSSIRRFEY